MHSCLYVPEIVGLICSHFRVVNRTYWQKYQDLVPFLLTCRALYRVVLPFVWSDIPHLTPLLQCMPEDLWRINGRCLEFTRELRPTDWPRFEMHARLVKGISLHYKYKEIPSPSNFVYRSLQVAACDRPFLPNIRSLNSHLLFNKECLTFLPCLVGQRLHRINVYHSWDTDCILWQTFFSNLPKFCPSLGDLWIASAIGAELETRMAIYSAVMELSRLCSLSIYSVSTEAFVHLTQLSSLTHLELGEDADNIDIPSTLPSSAFQFLTDFAAGNMAFYKCIRILKLMGRNSVLQSFSIEYYHESPVVDTSQWPELLCTIAATCSVQYLRKLYISDYDEMDVEAEADFAAPGLQVTSDDITPLLKFANLKNLCLSAYHGFNLNDAFIKDMAIALPRLQKLTFRMSTWPRPLPAIHLSSLRHFAQHQHLCYLGLTLNACGMSLPNTTTDDIKISNYGLGILHVGFSMILKRDVQYAAAFLSDIFPGLKHIYHHCGEFDDYPDFDELELNKDWCGVEHLMRTFAAVREQEIRRMRSLLVQ